MKQQNSISLLVTSGNGPAECRLAVAGVLKWMQKEAVDLDVSLDICETPAQHGPKSVVVVASGAASSRFGKRWCGTIQWQAKSNLRPHHKRANWFIGVFALPGFVSSAIRIKASDVTFDSFRAGGPGGQHQNTTDSAVRAIHQPSGLTVVAREMRSQHRNKAHALERLQALADVRRAAALDEQKCNQNHLHNALDRGRPVRIFKGTGFQEKGVCDARDD